ncbi:RibD family protein [Nitrosococcus wardiae]|uniref:RibD family protein n=1 Tax=Nitrosococcus wardiae TaxID=1814290 RepID=A0A4P7C3V7_9GAMM|nr:RibD family protein [Nitrosococcus wardiae]QBQ55636.1 RibD family protein [Nitrosococcus wardiae]
MECAVLDSSVDEIWESLLDFKRWCRNDVSAPETPCVFFYPHESGDQTPLWQFTANLEVIAKIKPKALIVVYLSAPKPPYPHLDNLTFGPIPTLLAFDPSALSFGESPWCYSRGPALPCHLLTAFRLYLPCLTGHHIASQNYSPWVSGHLAQTLDGKIAAVSGHSQWISNHADRKHAHRLRALHDAVLVGRSTVEKDNPRLTVREVQGENPDRVVLDRHCHLLAGEKLYRIFHEPGNNWLLHSSSLDKVKERYPIPEKVTPLPIRDKECGNNSKIMDLKAVLETMWAIGIRSVFVEGGGKTLSLFLAAGRTDLLHLHIAPLLLGSGLPSFQLPPVDRIQEGTYFHMTHFYLDKEILLECLPRHRP